MDESIIKQFEIDCQILGDEIVKLLNFGQYPKTVTLRVLGDLLKQLIEEAEDAESLKIYFINHLNSSDNDHIADCVAY